MKVNVICDSPQRINHKWTLIEKRGRAVCSVYIFDNEAWLCNLEVMEKYRGRGLASSMIRKAIDIAARMYTDYIYLAIDGNVHNLLDCERLESFYEQFGFVRYSVEDKYIIMRFAFPPKKIIP